MGADLASDFHAGMFGLKHPDNLIPYLRLVRFPGIKTKKLFVVGMVFFRASSSEGATCEKSCR
jgi:hypothetical protein